MCAVITHEYHTGKPSELVQIALILIGACLLHSSHHDYQDKNEMVQF